jgi:hypothetical protein
MPLKVLLFHCLPDPPIVGSFFKTTRGLYWLYQTFVFQYLLIGYGDWYYARRKGVAAWHRGWLERLDPTSKTLFSSFRLIVAREKAHAAGIGPLDPRYPSFAGEFATPDTEEK